MTVLASSAAARVPTFDELYRAIEALPPGLTGEILEPGVIWLVDPIACRAEILRNAGAHPEVVEIVEIVEGDVRRPLPPFASLIDTARWWVSPPT